MLDHGHPASLGDDELLQSIGRGCTDCFALLFHRYCRQVFSVSFRILRDKSETEDVLQEGLIRVENQGQNVSLTYIPHLDPTVGSLSPEAMRFTPEELRSACTMVLSPRGDGYAGEKVGSTICAQAIHGAIGKWTVEIEPGAIRLRNVQSGETLRFQRASR